MFSFMFKNKNLKVVPFKLPRYKDGSPMSLPVDGFPVSSKSLYNEQGWPMSDIGLLDRFAAEHRSSEELESIVARLQEIRASEPDNHGKTDAQIIKEIRPYWVQTASEMAQYENSLATYLGASDGQQLSSDDVVSEPDSDNVSS